MLARCIAEGLVGGVRFGADASLIKADASRYTKVDFSEWSAADAANRATQEYLDALDAAAFGAATPVKPKAISPADPAAIVEIFDPHEVSFVSVTQAFNTTSSMGRLKLNVMLSFAQFDREVTGERIRDKFAASKKNGMWMGGGLPLGYDTPNPRSHSLKVNEVEAHTVRHIFETYLALGSVHQLESTLYKAGIRSKRHVTKAGKETGVERSLAANDTQMAVQRVIDKSSPVSLCLTKTLIGRFQP